MKKIKKHDPRSEAAQREACKSLVKGAAMYVEHSRAYGTRVDVYAMDMEFEDDPIAIFDLRDCYRLRQPLKGIKKAFNKAIAPKRKK